MALKESEHGRIFRQLFPLDTYYKGTLLGNLLVRDSRRQARNILLKCVSGEHFASAVRSRLFREGTGCPLCKSASRKLSHFVMECSVFEEERREMCDGIHSISPALGRVFKGGVHSSTITAFLLTADESVFEQTVSLTTIQKQEVIQNTSKLLESIHTHISEKS